MTAVAFVWRPRIHIRRTSTPLALAALAKSAICLRYAARCVSIGWPIRQSLLIELFMPVIRLTDRGTVLPRRLLELLLAGRGERPPRARLHEPRRSLGVIVPKDPLDGAAVRVVVRDAVAEEDPQVHRPLTKLDRSWAIATVPTARHATAAVADRRKYITMPPSLSSYAGPPSCCFLQEPRNRPLWRRSHSTSFQRGCSGPQ